MDNIPIRKNTSSSEVNANLDVPPAVREQLEREAKNAVTNKALNVADDLTVPFEEFELPSKGYFYPVDSPLSSGKIKIKYMTAQEEDILSSESLIKKGVVLDFLLDRLIVTNGVSADDLLITDKNAVFVYARKLAYGSDYTTNVKCPECGADNEVTFDLNQLKMSEFDFSKYTKGINEFEYTFPLTKKTVKFKLLKGVDEKSIREELKAMSRFDKSGKSPEITTRLKKMIVSVDGKEDKGFIKQFVDNLPSRDSLSFRKNLGSHTPTLDLTFNFECEECGHVAELPIPIDVKFFWPDA